MKDRKAGSLLGWIVPSLVGLVLVAVLLLPALAASGTRALFLHPFSDQTETVANISGATTDLAAHLASEATAPASTPAAAATATAPPLVAAPVVVPHAAPTAAPTEEAPAPVAADAPPSQDAPPPADATPAPAPTPPAGPVQIDVILAEWKVKPQVATAAAGAVVFNAENKGASAHELVVIKSDMAADKLPMADGKVEEDKVGAVVGKIDAFDSASSLSNTLDLAPGHYVLICNIAGHYQQGMHADFTVGG